MKILEIIVVVIGSRFKRERLGLKFKREGERISNFKMLTADTDKSEHASAIII